MTALVRKPFSASDYKIADNDLDTACIAMIEAGSSYRIMQLEDGQVIVCFYASHVRKRTDPYFFVIGEPMSYSDALRFLADTVDAL